jgi:peptide/nickel transport system ATP-binding protein
MLEIRNLKVKYLTNLGEIKAVNNFSFKLEQGDKIGIAGESGCGKSSLIKAIVRILPSNTIVDGEIFFKDKNLLAMEDEEFRKTIRWKEISIIPQSAMNALNPVYRVSDQIVEAIRTHSKIPRNEALEKTEKLLEYVGLNPTRMYDYPHQLSGGMKQRVMIAMAIALNPSLLIADEPTTALDVIVQHRILKRIIEIQKELENSLIMISHDISLIAQTCNKIIIMYAGKIMECGDIDGIFYQPYHPYTLGLQNAFPNINILEQNIVSIPGLPPSLIDLPEGCLFADRCPFSQAVCKKEEVNQFEVEEGHFVSCLFTDKAEEFRRLAKSKDIWKMRS